MKKDSRLALRPRDYVVIILCLTGTAISLNLFRLDLYRTLLSQNAVQVGTITFKRHTAQRRMEDRVIWDRLRQKSPLYNGDLIRTAEQSLAVIHLPVSTPGKTRDIDLEENTLIQIRINAQGETEINLANGSLNVAAGGSGDVVINVQGSRIRANSSTALGASAGAGGIVVQVAQGSALFSGPSGSREIPSGAVIALNNNGTERTEPAVLVYNPRPDAHIFNSQSSPTPASFSWNRINLDEELIIEIAQDRNFTRINQSIAARESSALAELPPGTWYWRINRAAVVVGANAASANAESPLAQGRITVAYAPAPAPIGPAPDYVYHFRTKSLVRFQWTETAGAAGYILEAADNPDFTNPRISEEVSGTSLESSALGAGRWYWRVHPVLPGTSAVGTSAVSSFTIEQDLAALQEPLPISPSADGYLDQDRDLYFSWQKGNEAESYTIRIAAREDLQNPLVKSTTRDNYYKETAGKLEQGRYYWAVSQTDAEGNESPVSAVRSFVVAERENILRTVFPPNNYTAAEALISDIHFTWKSNLPFETKYQLAEDAEFSRLLVNEAVKGESLRGRPLPAGTYYWRIYAEAPGQVYQTPAQRITLAEDFPAPAAELPLPGSRIVIRAGQESSSFRWRSIDGAEYYQVRIYGNNRNPLYEQTLRANTFQLERLNRFENGPYYWTIQAFADEGPGSTRRSGLVGQESFILRKLQALTLDWPETGAAITEQPAIVRWSTQETLGRSRFILSRNPNPLGGRTVMEIPNPGRTITLTRLPEGTYYWTVAAETQDGFDLSAAPRYFQVLAGVSPDIPQTAENPLVVPVEQQAVRPPVVIPPVLPPVTPQAVTPQTVTPQTQQPERLPVVPPQTVPPVERPAPITRPVEQQPTDGKVIGPAELQENRSIVFSWEPVPEAARYIITLFRVDENGRQQLIEAETKGPSWTLDDLRLLNRGNFIWKVDPVYQKADGSFEQQHTTAENRFSLEVPLPDRVQPGNTGVLYGR
ncbi:hypothetical protein AGMMS50230_03190 [Spirochaetia bacterium]|nr:hypothetical protein AGMMS50230_03190 [Spirochaetia bacterium]